MLLKIVIGVSLFLCADLVCAGATVAGFRKSDLQELLDLTGTTYDGTLVGLVESTQKAWLGQSVASAKKYEDIREKLVPLLRKMWLVDEWINQYFTYKYILFMVSEIDQETEERLLYLHKLLAVPVNTESLVFLSADRPLAPHEKQFLQSKGWHDLPATQLQALELLCRNHKIVHENSVWIRTPSTALRDNSLRSSTTSMVNYWLQKRPVPQAGKLLVISAQPFCNYQQMIVEALVPKNFIVKTVGAKARSDRPVADYLKVLAHTLQGMVSG